MLKYYGGVLLDVLQAQVLLKMCKAESRISQRVSNLQVEGASFFQKLVLL